MRFEKTVEHDGQMVKHVMEPERENGGTSLGESYSSQRVFNLPCNWRELEWYRLWDAPCLSGGDSYVALDKEAQIAYAVFDNYCNAWASTNELRDVFEENVGILTGVIEADSLYDLPREPIECIDVEFDSDGEPVS